jgi:hypothetical protein
MSVAITVQAADSQKAVLQINDNDGGTWTYTRGCVASDSAQVHVEFPPPCDPPALGDVPERYTNAEAEWAGTAR